MTEEEMKAIAEAATKAASAAVTQATVKMGEDFSTLKSENEGLKKIVDDLNAEVKAGKAEVHKMGETLVKATKGFGGVSIVKDLELASPSCPSPRPRCIVAWLRTTG